MKKISNWFKSVGSNSFVNKIINNVSPLIGSVPVVGPVLDSTLKSVPKTLNGIGTLIDERAEGKGLSDALHNYFNNTDLLGNPLNMLTLPNEGIRALKDVLKKY